MWRIQTRKLAVTAPEVVPGYTADGLLPSEDDLGLKPLWSQRRTGMATTAETALVSGGASRSTELERVRQSQKILGAPLYFRKRPDYPAPLKQDCHMRRLHSLLLSSILLVAPLSVTAAVAQSTTTSTGSVVGGTSSTAVIPPTKNSGTKTGMVRKVSPDSASAQLANPTGAQPGTGSGMGKVSGTAAGN